MKQYILRRILIFIPTLFIITLLAFIISVNAPGDPVERILSQGNEQGFTSQNEMQQALYWRKKLGLNLTLFYLSIHSLSTPDTLHKIYNKAEKETLERLIHAYGNWNEISDYYKAVIKLNDHFENNQTDFIGSADDLRLLKFQSLSLRFTYDENQIQQKLNEIEKLNHNSWFKNDIENIKTNFNSVKGNSTRWKNYIPVISFHGMNQYHRWLFGDGVYSKGILCGDFGISYVTRQPVSQVIGEKIFWSLFFSLTAVVIAYIVSIPAGVKAGANKNSRFDKISSLVFFLLYSLPVFWVGTLLLMTFANTDVLNIFPASGVRPANGFPENASWWEKLRISIPYLILPLICYTYGSFAFLSRTMRASIIEILQRDFIRTARAKGLPESKVIWKHALRNALFPIITVFANVFPFAISGSVIIETIFTIPGMGFETVAAIQNQNYPMIIAVFTITGLLTLSGFLVSDILYALADPRVSL